MPPPLRSPRELRALLHDVFPFLLDDNVDSNNNHNVVHAFGYGSGVLPQQQQPSGSDTESNEEKLVVDAIVVVRDAELFHRANLRCNAHHYNSTMQSPHACAWLQRHRLPTCVHPYLNNPGVYFHVVRGTANHNSNIKYGVVELSDLAADLRHWTCLYLAGRLQKPVVHVPIHMNEDNDNDYEDDDNVVLKLQNEHNLPAALAAGLLLQSNDDDKITDEPQPPPNDSMARMQQQQQQELYARIASLSYQGDFRVAVGAEDPHKISRLVATPHLPRWNALYQPATRALREEGILTATTTTATTATTTGMDQQQSSALLRFDWDDQNPLAHARLWRSLPRHVRQKCRIRNDNATAHSLKVYQAAARTLPTILESIVAPAARYQSMKGLWTAGISTSAAYAWRKLQKGRG